MTSEGFFTCVAAHVGGQLSPVHKTLATLLTLEFLVVLIVLLPLVLADCHFMGEGLATHITGYWPVTCVCCHVHCILRPPHEAFVTELTHKFGSVCLPVEVHLLLAVTHLATLTAGGGVTLVEVKAQGCAALKGDGTLPT